MSKRVFVGSLVVLFAILLAGPLPVGAQDGPLVVKGEHLLQIRRADPAGETGIIENIFLENQGDEPFEGEIFLDLHPEASELRHYWHNATGAPYPGEPGQVDESPLATEDMGDHVRHVLDLAERNMTLAPGETAIMVLQYATPAEVDDFTRGFTMDTPVLTVFMADVPGLRPQSDETPLEPTRDPRSGAWTYSLAPGASGPFSDGDSFSFDWETTQEALEPLRVDIQVTGEDPLELTASATGGIPDYEYAWDLTGDGSCEDAQGATVEVETETDEVNRITACVTDSSGAPGEARQTFQVGTFISEGAWDGPSPWLLLVIGVLGGGLLVFSLTQGGFIRMGGRASAATGPAYGAESRQLLETRQRVMVAALKELEIAKKKGEVPDDQYTALKSELKKDTVSVMRELERRKTEKETV